MLLLVLCLFCFRKKKKAKSYQGGLLPSAKADPAGTGMDPSSRGPAICCGDTLRAACPTGLSVFCVLSLIGGTRLITARSCRRDRRCFRQPSVFRWPIQWPSATRQAGVAAADVWRQHRLAARRGSATAGAFGGRRLPGLKPRQLALVFQLRGAGDCNRRLCGGECAWSGRIWARLQGSTPGKHLLLRKAPRLCSAVNQSFLTMVRWHSSPSRGACSVHRLHSCSSFELWIVASVYEHSRYFSAGRAC